MIGLFRNNIAKMSTQSYNFVNGSRINSTGFKKIDVYLPATGSKLFEIPCSSRSDVDVAIDSAFKAFPSWSFLSGFERGNFLRQTAAIIRQKSESIAQLEVADTGKPIWEARADIECCANTFEYYAGIAANAVHGTHHQLSNGSFAQVLREPLGVVAGIGAWNYPFQVMTWKAAPALACGNTFVFKPSEMTPLSAVVLAECMTEAGIPGGVVNVVQGDGETGRFLCEHPSVAKVTFTGSVATGQKIMSLCANGMKRVTLELGGKSPLIVFDDCDLVQAVKATMLGNFLTQGEVCSNCTRVFVHKSIAKPFVNKLIEATAKMVIGNPVKDETTVGATISEQHALKVIRFMENAVKAGAKIAAGGERVLLEGDLKAGYYLSPCIVTNCNDDMEVVKEEIFGAVVCILEFDDETEVIGRANSTPFGLAAGVMTKDLKRGHRVAGKLAAGTVWINNYNVFPVEVPFGGFKMSGFGRENGLASVENYTQTKTVYVEMGDDIDCPIYKL